MGIAYNTNMARNGLVLCLDTANTKCAKGRSKNILSWNDWVAGTTGGVTSTVGPSYYSNGDGNSRVSDTNPFGATDVVWDVSNQDATSDADGGWEGQTFAIDPNKMYRFSTWVRRKTIGNGSFYLGPHSNWAATAGGYILNRSNGAENQNPYFVAQTWWGNANDWYLVIGHVWPAGSGTGSPHPDSGVYTTAGVKLFSSVNFTWASTNTTSFLRSYLYYSTDTSTNQQWYHPRVEICDGNEPTLAELLGDVGNKLYDLTGNGNHSTISNNPNFVSTNGGVLDLDGTNDYGSSTSTATTDLTGTATCECWFKIDGIPNDWVRVFGKGDSSNRTYGLWYNYNSSVFLYQRYGTSGVSVSHSTALSTGVWYHMVGVSEGVNHRMYLNGVEVGSATNGSSTFYSSTEGYRVGAATYHTYHNGPIQVVRLYNVALTEEQIVQNYRSLRGRFGI